MVIFYCLLRLRGPMKDCLRRRVCPFLKPTRRIVDRLNFSTHLLSFAINII